MEAPVLVDANILLYAEDELSPFHRSARQWWDECLSGTSPVYLSWSVVGAFIRIASNPRVFESPLSLAQAVERVQSWLQQPCVRIIRPANQHWDVFQEMLFGGQAQANLVPDAHLAALALEHGCSLCSTDSDFSRFPRIQWINPITES